MQRHLLFALVAVGALLAGCAQDGTTPGTPDGGGTPPASVSNERAAQLFADAAGNIPDKFGMTMTATKSGVAIMTANAAFDNTTQTSFFRMELDDSLADMFGEGGAMMGADASMFQTFSVYASPQGNAILFNDSVILTEPDNAMFQEASSGGEGFGALTDPEGLIGEMHEDGFTVNSVTPTTLRGKGALKIDATVDDEDAGTQNVTVWLFQEPTRVTRVQAAMPNEPTDEGEPDPFAGATMEMDFLYDDEVSVTTPTELVRALGLRYESNRSPFQFGGGEDGPEIWTFQVDGGLAVSEITVEVGDMEADEPEWTMPLSAVTKTEGGITITFLDADADGKLSNGDTLTIDRAEDADFVTIALRDTVTGLRVVPGAGLVLGLLALAAVALLARRK